MVSSVSVIERKLLKSKGNFIFPLGAGIFVLSGHAAAQYAGPSIIISFIISGIVTILAGLSFSELSTMMCHSGAAYTFTFAGSLVMSFLIY